VLFLWAILTRPVNMTRMQKDRGVVLAGAGETRRTARAKEQVALQLDEGEFVRAFADALRDILRHESRRRRAA
jgi:hypothetical protein